MRRTTPPKPPRELVNWTSIGTAAPPQNRRLTMNLNQLWYSIFVTSTGNTLDAHARHTDDTVIQSKAKVHARTHTRVVSSVTRQGAKSISALLTASNHTTHKQLQRHRQNTATCHHLRERHQEHRRLHEAHDPHALEHAQIVDFQHLDGLVLAV